MFVTVFIIVFVIIVLTFITATYLTNKIIAAQQDTDTFNYILKNIYKPIQKSLGIDTSSLSIQEISTDKTNAQETLNFQETVQNIGCS